MPTLTFCNTPIEINSYSFLREKEHIGDCSHNYHELF